MGKAREKGEEYRAGVSPEPVDQACDVPGLLQAGAGAELGLLWTKGRDDGHTRREGRAVVSAGPPGPDSLGSNPGSATYEVCVLGQFRDLWELYFLPYKMRRLPPHRLNELRI